MRILGSIIMYNISTKNIDTIKKLLNKIVVAIINGKSFVAIERTN